MGNSEINIKELRKITEKAREDAQNNKKIKEKNQQKEIERKAQLLAEKILKELPEKIQEAAKAGKSEVLVIEYCALKLVYIKNQPELYIPARALKIMEKDLLKMEKDGYKFDLRQNGNFSPNYSLYICW